MHPSSITGDILVEGQTRYLRALHRRRASTNRLEVPLLETGKLCTSMGLLGLLTSLSPVKSTNLLFLDPGTGEQVQVLCRDGDRHHRPYFPHGHGRISYKGWPAIEDGMGRGLRLLLRLQTGLAKS